MIKRTVISKKHNRRIISIDIVRGIAVLLMILAHTIAFIHTHEDGYLNLLQNVGDTVCFTIFLLTSGAAFYFAYINANNYEWGQRRKKLSRRIVKILLGYYLVASIITIKSSLPLPSIDWIKTLIQILLFLKIPNYTEFLLPFICYSLFVLLFKNKLQNLVKNTTISLLTGSAAYMLGSIIYNIPVPAFLTSYKAILAGEANTFSFPLLQYFSVFLMGILLGRFLLHTKPIKAQKSQIYKITFGLFCLLGIILIIEPLRSLPYSQTLQRWPPSIAFLLTGLCVNFASLSIIKTRFTALKPFEKTLTFLGQNAFSFYFYHILILQLSDLTQKTPQAPLTLVTFAVVLGICTYFTIIFPKLYTNYFTTRPTSSKFPKIKTAGFFAKNKYLISAIFIILISTLGTIKGTSYLIATFPNDTEETNNEDPQPTPHAEETNSPELEFEFSGYTNRKWILRGIESTSEYATLVYTAETTDINLETSPCYEIMNTSKTGELKNLHDGNYQAVVDIENLPFGTYQIQATITHNGEKLQTEPATFHISAPLYVSWTMDWEGVDTEDKQLANITTFTQQHHNLPITHFFNPRIYVTEDVSPQRREVLTNWVLNRQTYGDEIGLHLHMHHDLVEAAGVTVRKEPKWTNNLENGHDVPCSTYTTEEFTQILNWAKLTFLNNGINFPTSFRAGGWFVNLETLQALDNTDFTVESSGREYYVWGQNGLKGHWDLNSTTQPYHPSHTNQNTSTPAPNFNLWEFPNNGADSHFYKTEDLIKRFNENRTENVLTQYKVITYLSHPHAFHEDQEVLNPLYDYIDQYLAESDLGPVIYTTLEQIVEDIDPKHKL